MGDDWGPWIEHDGRGCPCRGQYVAAQGRDGVVTEFIAGTLHCIRHTVIAQFSWDENEPNAWRWGSGAPRSQEIIRYRIRKPHGLTILENLIADLPEKVDA